MGFFKKLINDFKCYNADKRNKKQWVVEIEQEMADPLSTFNKFNMGLSEDRMQLTYVVNIPENYQIATNDAIKYQKLMELIQPVNHYIIHLGWAEYFPYKPDFFHVDIVDTDNPKAENELDGEDVSCAYLAVWDFSPIIAEPKKFMAKFISVWSGIVLAVGGIIATVFALLK